MTADIVVGGLGGDGPIVTAGLGLSGAADPNAMRAVLSGVGAFSATLTAAANGRPGGGVLPARLRRRRRTLVYRQSRMSGQSTVNARLSAAPVVQTQGVAAVPAVPTFAWTRTGGTSSIVAALTAAAVTSAGIESSATCRGEITAVADVIAHPRGASRVFAEGDVDTYSRDALDLMLLYLAGSR